MLTYLEKHDLTEIDASFRPRLLAARKSIGRVGLRVLHSIVDASLTGRLWGRLDLLNAASIVWRAMTCSGRPSANMVRVPFGLLFPGDESGRFSIGSRLRRVRSALRKLGGLPRH